MDWFIWGLAYLCTGLLIGSYAKNPSLLGYYFCAWLWPILLMIMLIDLGNQRKGRGQ